jgi:hypothetical protein
MRHGNFDVFGHDAPKWVFDQAFETLQDSGTSTIRRMQVQSTHRLIVFGDDPNPICYVCHRFTPPFFGSELLEIPRFIEFNPNYGGKGLSLKWIPQLILSLQASSYANRELAALSTRC